MAAAASAHQMSEVVGAARITAEQAVIAQLPEVARLRHRRRRRPRGIDSVGGIRRVFLEVRGELVDLDRRKAGDRDVEALDHQDLRKLGQLDGQELAVPAGILGDLVVGEGERAALGLGQSLQLDCRHLL